MKMYPKKITLNNNGIEYQVKVSHWQKDGKSRLYINDLGLAYDLVARKWMDRYYPDRAAIAKQVAEALNIVHAF
jgi:hypothetical protein